MNVQLLQALIALQSVPTPDPQPESLEPKPPWLPHADPPVVDDPIGEPHAPNFHAPPRGRIVSQAKGPNRAQRRGRG